MKRSPLRRLTPLVRRKRLNPRSRKAIEMAPRRAAFVARILSERPTCEAPGCIKPSADVHEKLTRARGGDILDPLNVLALCRSHHDWVHDHPEKATEMGLLVSGFSS